ncbi:hypothetical protein NCG89_13965 [Spongiibacter taiwanensis]|uniref:hypothetical protein n=1 Tax=Spongiibacter taiwanensis TaxID=1748242 RepID=UPI0020360656|nr:hypothetical protein [Spongiibacter taiwanensis]USA42636.1 hypothetical protein NCG89_13965 [Spongiibacter taiwanensis]
MPLLTTSALDLTHTLPPEGTVMPATAQLVTTVVYGLAGLVFVAYAIVLAKRERSALPLLLLFGSMTTLYLEPIVDVLGNAMHPVEGQYNVLTTNGHPVPLAVLVGYIWYFAALPLMCYSMMKQRTLNQAFVWKSFAAVVLSAALVEQIPLHFGVWIYYGEQPFKIGYIPAWWCFANTAAVLVPFLLIYGLMPKLTGLRSLLVPAIMPCGAFMGHAASGWPMYNALGIDTVNAPDGLLPLASVASIAFSIMIVWVVMEMQGIPRRKETDV